MFSHITPIFFEFVGQIQRTKPGPWLGYRCVRQAICTIAITRSMVQKAAMPPML
jgi:hypothetical protein